ncbi:MAG: bifunctional metallophosphatase/5'-nucleotidase [Anaerolineae bacterium]|jgi:5'-nucleotidase / UDP-sugar diphosphatase|nr:bifunctional metallophosphatase/5'-nucleotidase [Anaerolineae bacterium]MBT7783057.1 bifunctional metallophosphatase/5'-nucleotidase [Anaerolineae bacterium]
MKIIPSPSQKGLFLFVGDATRPVSELVWDADGAHTFQLAKHPSTSASLTVLHFNDLHGRLRDFSRIARRINELRARPNTTLLTLSAGDDMVGTPFDELLGSQNPAYQLYSAVGLDACALGNHDFDYGTEALAKGIQMDANFPVLSANLKNSENLKGLYSPAVLYVKNGIRIGIIGLSTQAQIRYPLHSHLEITDPVPVAQNLVAAIRPICDVLIILSHLGYSKKARLVASPEVGDVELAEALPAGSVDLIVGGHSHNALNENGLHTENIVNEIPIVQAGGFGEHIGEVEVEIGKKGVSLISTSLKKTETLAPDDAFEEAELKPLISDVEKIENTTLGKVANNPQLGVDAAKQQFALGELALANFITKGITSQLKKNGYKIDFSTIDSSSMVSGVPFGGDLTFSDWFKVMPFADTVRIYQITGQELKDLLKDNALRMSRAENGEKERGFLQFGKEIRYTIDLDEVSANEIYINGTPIEEELNSTYSVATSIFTRELAGKWENAKEKESGVLLQKLQNLAHKKTDVFLRKLLVAYIREQGGITEAGGAKLDGRLRVAENN